MPAPTVLGRVVTFPANSKYVIGSGLSRTVIDISTTDVTLDACTSAAVVDQSINWKQSAAAALFVNCHPLSWVGKTAISGASATVNGTPVSAGNVKTHARGMIYTDLAVADPLQMALVSYSYKRERYDLLQLNTATGVVTAKKGTEDDFAAPEFLPVADSGNVPLFYA